jgi:hypothetical protein
MSVKEQFYNQRPAVLFDPRASQRIDPRFTFTRNSTGTYFDREGVMRSASIGAPRLEYSFETKEYRGLLIEPSSSNLFQNSGLIQPTVTSYPSNWTGWNPALAYRSTAIAPDGQANIFLHGALNINGGGLRQTKSGLIPNGVYAMSIYARRPTSSELAEFKAQHGETTGTGSGASNKPWVSAVAISIEGASPRAHALPASGEWVRCVSKVTAASDGTLNFAIINTRQVGLDEGAVVALWGVQLEPLPFATSLIPTAIGATATRAADLLSVDTVSVPSTGSIYLDAQANGAAVNDTLLSVANSSDEKLLLQTQAPVSLYNSLALVYAIDDTFEPTLPFPVPEPGDQRNIITWGDNNYHYQKSNYRKTPSLTASIPENLDRIGIGHDVTDPTKGFNGTLGRLYLWANELPPEIARGLVRGNITVPLNADDGNVIPVAAHALIFNTQGAIFDGDKVIRFQLLGSNNSVSIDWNDGIIETYAGSAANTTITHTYETPGLYLVTITGVFENIKLGNFTGSQASDLLNVAQNGPDWSPTNLTDLYNGCTLLKNEALDDFPDTSLITQYVRAFQSCSSLTSFPLINTAAGTNFSFAWSGCSSLTSFPLINTAAGTNFSNAWLNCSSLTSFPLINTAAGTNFSLAWRGCSSLTSFPLINTAAGTSFSNAWLNCSSLTSFPLINTAAGTNFSLAWRGCSSLTSFPLINTAAGTSFFQAWQDCTSLTSFPLINTSSGTNFDDAWFGCSSLTSFPLINTAAGTNFSVAWQDCTSLTAFPALDFDAAVGLASDDSNTNTGFRRAWNGCTSLADFPANLFDNTTCTRYLDAFINCALTAQSIENILVSINTANTSNGNLGLSGGTNAVKTSWTANANTAYDALVARGWTITFRP